MHNYSSIRGWVAPLRLPSVSAKFTARFGQMKTVARMGRDRDAFTLAPDQAAGGYRIGEIIDITFDHVRDADAGDTAFVSGRFIIPMPSRNGR